MSGIFQLAAAGLVFHLLLLKTNRWVSLMNFMHGSGEERHEFEFFSHLLWTGEHHKAVVDQLLLLAVTACQQLLTPGSNATRVEEL